MGEIRSAPHYRLYLLYEKEEVLLQQYLVLGATVSTTV